MADEDPIQVALKFIEKINEHNPDALAEMMTDDHAFVDSLGSTFEGKETMRGGWGHYFSTFPDFTITCTEILQKGNLLGMFGTASGTYAPDGELREENHWQMPGAWRAVVKDNRIAAWHVYVDNHPVLEIMAANRR
jgi:ketosteroid isomerase-like protein